MNLKCVSHQILVESHPIPLHDTEGAENLMWLIGLRLRRVWELTVQSKCDLLCSVIRQMSKMGRQGYLYGDSLIKRNTVNNKTIFNNFCDKLGSWRLFLLSNKILTFWDHFCSSASAKSKCGLKFYTNLNLAKWHLIQEEKIKFEVRSGRGGQNGQKWPQNGPKWPKNKMSYFDLNYLW